MSLKPRKKRPPIIPTGEWIRDHLMLVGEDYAYSMWKQFSTYLILRGVTPPPSYQSFARYIWILKRLRLIQPTRIEYTPHGKPRQYYRLTPGAEFREEEWKNPQKILYGEKVALGRRRYRRRVLKLPPKPRGRPRRARE